MASFKLFKSQTWMKSYSSFKLLLLFLCVLGTDGGYSSNPLSFKLIDLSQELSPTIPFLPGSRPYKHTPVVKTVEAISFRLEYSDFLTHTGTHLDAPYHFNESGWAVKDIPLDRLTMRPLWVMDIRDRVFDHDTAKVISANYSVSVHDIKHWEYYYGPIPDGAVILLNTGWSRFWPDTVKYFGINEADKDSEITFKQLNFPGFSVEAAKWIAEHRNVYGVGTDTLGPDRSGSVGAHVALASKPIYNLENLCCLHKLPPIGAYINVGLVKVGGLTSGFPIRAVALIPFNPVYTVSYPRHFYHKK